MSSSPAARAASSTSVSLDRAALLAVALGAALRIGWAATSPFPRTDGGLFLVMIEDLKANGYALPAFTSYDGGTIPFAYPPLAFYLGGLASDLLHVDLLQVVRFQGAVLSSLAVLAFAMFAQLLLQDRRATFASTLVFAVLPWVVSWQAAGGGLTRSLGCLFAFLLLISLLRFYRHGARTDIAFASVAGAMTLLSHPDWAEIAVGASALLLVCYGRTREGVIGTVLAGLAAVALASIWWIPVVLRHSLTPFLATLTNSAEVWAPGSALPALLRPAWGGESLPVFSLFAIAGIAIAFRHGMYFLPLWLVAAFGLVVRGHPQSTAAPIALLAGPALAGLWALGGSRPEASRARRRGQVALHAALAGVVTLGVTLNLLATATRGFGAEFSPDHRSALEWARVDTPEDAEFLLFRGNTWEASLEWFPVLSGRRSLTTATGYEWVPGEFSRRVRANAELGRCAEGGLDCLEAWFSRWGRPRYLFVYKRSPAPPDSERCCATFADRLRTGPYPVDFENNDVVIFRVTG